MSAEPLVRMANDIAAYFAADPDGEAAAAGTADHMRRFWDPRMRRKLAAYAQAGGVGLSPVAAAALRLLADDGRRLI